MSILRATLCLALLAGCETTPLESDPDASTPAASTSDASAGGPTCTVDAAAMTLRCVRWEEADPAAIDDESRFEIVLAFGAGAFDGTARSIAGESDYVVTELSGDGLTIDESMVAGLAAGSSNDALVSDVLVWVRVHNLFSDDVYRRVGVTGTASVDAEGHGHVELAWTEAPSTSYGQAGSLVADF